MAYIKLVHPLCLFKSNVVFISAVYNIQSEANYMYNQKPSCFQEENSQISFFDLILTAKNYESRKKNLQISFFGLTFTTKNMDVSGIRGQFIQAFIP